MAPRPTILLAEDNPLVRGLLVRALEPLAEITIARDGAEALLKAAEQKHDLIVADYTLPGLDGEGLLEKLRSRAATSEMGFILMAPRSELEEKLRHARDLADEIVEKPFLAGEAVARIRRVLERIELRRAALVGDGGKNLRGRLAQMGVVDLLQAMELGRKSGRLALTRASQSADIWVSEGRPVHAICGALSGEAAVFEVLSWEDGTFELDFAAAPATAATITRTAQSLMMEGLRLLDESRHAAAEADNAAIPES